MSNSGNSNNSNSNGNSNGNANSNANSSTSNASNASPTSTASTASAASATSTAGAASTAANNAAASAAASASASATASASSNASSSASASASASAGATGSSKLKSPYTGKKLPYTSNKVYTVKDYLLDPYADPVAAIKELHGKYSRPSGTAHQSHVDNMARGKLSLGESILKGTFDISSQLYTVGKHTANYSKKAFGAVKSVGDFLVKKAAQNQFFSNVNETLLGEDGKNYLFNMKRDLVESTVGLYKEAGKLIAARATGDPEAGIQQTLSQGSSAVIKAMKIAGLSASGQRMDVSSMLRDSIIVDIETAGLFKDAPIMQLAMVDINAIQDVTKISTEDIQKLTPKEQIEKGFLSMYVMPEAIIRDIDTSIDPTTGEARKPTYKMFSYFPKSLEEFKEKFGSWAAADKYRISDFYKHFADSTTGEISEDKLKEIALAMEEKGYVELGDGTKFYSQREAAKWSMYMSKLAANENKRFVAANLPFESFRIGKLWNYFIKDDPDLAAAQGILDKDKAVNLRLNVNNEIDNVLFKELNEDPDLLEAFGKEADSRISGHREVRNMLSATWRSKYKLNILDENNFWFVTKANRMAAKREQQNLISLFPEFMRRTGTGLKTTDQLALTKMFFSGLIQTGYSTKDDIFSGTAIDYATRIVLGETETHAALSDVLHQGRLLTEGKLVSVTQDIFNIAAAKSTTSFASEFKSFMSSLGILTDRRKQAWFSLSDIVRESSTSVTDITSNLNIEYEGSISSIKRSFNRDKELLRIAETVDSWTGIEDAMFSPQSTAAATVTKDIVKEDGTIEQVSIKTSGKEPFSLADPSGATRHEMLTSDDQSLYVNYRKSSYDLEKKVKERFEKLTKADGLGEEEARNVIRGELVDKYSESIGVASTGTRTGDLHMTWDLYFKDLSREQRREILKARMEGKSEVRNAAGQVGSLNDILFSDFEDRIRETSERAKQDFQLSEEGVKDIFNSVKSVFFASGQSANTGTGANVKLSLRPLEDIRDNLKAVSLDSLKAAPNKFIQRTFGVDEKLATLAMQGGGRMATVLAGGAAVTAGLGLGYAIDEPSWKMTTGEILKMTGKENPVMEEEHIKKAGSLKNITTPYTGSYNQSNPLTAATGMSRLDTGGLRFMAGDGDTVSVVNEGMFGIGKSNLGSVRLTGMDTPETFHEGSGGPGQMPFADKSKQYLQNVLSARTGASILVSNTETFGRNVGIVTDNIGTNYSYEMVEQGLASALFRDTPQESLIDQTAFIKAESIARKKEAGMWSDPFYYGAQARFSPRERKGWNRLTPQNVGLFSLPSSPGTTEEQQAELYSSTTFMDSPPTIDAFMNSSNTSMYSKKQSMAVAQQQALANSMQRNRGRAKERR